MLLVTASWPWIVLHVLEKEIYILCTKYVVQDMSKESMVQKVFYCAFWNPITCLPFCLIQVISFGLSFTCTQTKGYVVYFSTDKKITLSNCSVNVEQYVCQKTGLSPTYMQRGHIRAHKIPQECQGVEISPWKSTAQLTKPPPLKGHLNHRSSKVLL